MQFQMHRCRYVSADTFTDTATDGHPHPLGPRCWWSWCRHFTVINFMIYVKAHESAYQLLPTPLPPIANSRTHEYDMVRMVWYGMVWYGMGWHGMARYGIVKTKEIGIVVVIGCCCCFCYRWRCVYGFGFCTPNNNDDCETKAIGLGLVG